MPQANTTANHGDAGCWLLIMQMVVVAGKNVSLWGNSPHYPLGESTLKMLGRGHEVGDTMVNSLFISGNLDHPPCWMHVSLQVWPHCLHK